MRLKKNLYGAVLLSLLVLLQGCASAYSAPQSVLCKHPEVSLSTNAGLVQGLVDYHSALELCNKMNGE